MNLPNEIFAKCYFDHRFLVLFAIIIILLMGMVGGVKGDVPLTSETVTSTGTNLLWTSIGSDASGNPFIFSGGNLYHKEGSAWVNNPVNPLGIFDPTVVMDQQQNPHLFYTYPITSNEYALYHAQWNSSIPAGSPCIMEQIRTRPDDTPYNPEYGYAGRNDAVLDSSGKINLVYAYYGGTWGPLYTRQNASGWSTPVRIQPGFIWTWDLSLKADENDNLYLAFINGEAFQNPKGLYFAKKTPSGNWVNEIVIEGTGVGGTALVIDQDTVRIIYGYFNAATQKYEVKMASRQTDGTWTHELLFDNATGGVQAIDAEIKDGVLYVVLGHGTGSNDDRKPVLISKELPAGTPTYQTFGPLAYAMEIADVSMVQNSQKLLISHNFNRDTLIYTTVKLTPENRAPELGVIGNKTVAEGTELTFTLTGTDTDGQTLTYSSTALPSGATLTGAVFAWTPGFDQAGSYPITFTVSDGVLTDFEAIIITVADTNQAPELGVIGNKAVAEGTELTFTLTATDPDGQTLTYSSTALPTGATLTGAVFAWTPPFDQAGSYPITFTVSDGTLTDFEIVTITVSDVNRPPVLAAIGPQSVSAGNTLTFTIAATDPDAGSSLVFTAGNLPARAAFDPAAKTFTWTPTSSQAGSYAVIFTASDGLLSSSENVAITVIPVSPVNQNPVAEAGAAKTVLVNESATFDGSQSADPDGSITSFTWIYGDGTTGTGVTTSHSYTAPGMFAVTLSIVDNEGATGTDTTTVTVKSGRQSLQEVIDLIKSMNLQKGTENSLTSKLENAIKSLDKNNINAAKNQVSATINEITAQSEKKIPADRATTLLAALQKINQYL